MKEVDELVEWVTIKIWQWEHEEAVARSEIGNKYPEELADRYEPIAKLILSHPDLALIVKKELPLCPYRLENLEQVDPATWKIKGKNLHGSLGHWREAERKWLEAQKDMLKWVKESYITLAEEVRNGS